jgi:hypothetical protein
MTGHLADHKGLKIVGFSFASVTLTVMLLTAVVVQRSVANDTEAAAQVAAAVNPVTLR